MTTDTTSPRHRDGREDRRRQRAAATAFLVAALLLLGGNIAHPIDAEMTATSRLELATGAWMPIHLVVAGGMLALATGFVLLAGTGRGHAGLSAALRMVAVVGGSALAFVFAGLDGHGMVSLVEARAAGASAVAVEAAAIALTAIDTGLSGLGTLCLLGIAFVLAGTVAVRGAAVPTWLGVASVVVGLAGTVTGLALLGQGATPLTINGLLRPTAVGATVVTVAFGVSLLRRATEPAGHRGTSPAPVG